MEHILKAFEKAQMQKGKERTDYIRPRQPAARPRLTTIDDVMQQESKTRNVYDQFSYFDKKPRITSLDKIVYSETKVVPVDAKTLLEHRVIAALKNDPRSDIFRILRTKVLQRMRANNANVLAVTGPTQGVGKTLVAINLAVSIAMDANYSVLLLDLDLRRPSMHKYFGLSPAFGLVDFLEGRKQIPELLINPGIERLVLMPVNKPSFNSSELLALPKMLAFIAEVKARYPNRIIVVDLPPLLPTNDAMAFIPNVDACVLVTAEGESTRDDIERSLQLIDAKKFMGVILNKSSDVGIPEYG